jgi:radical SAM superfamily enzyme YgiQ (UPF0313 family)
VSVCDAILACELNGQIEWVANSRVRPLKGETLTKMKEAGCWLVAFGFETGHPETMKLIKKGASIEDNLAAAKLTKDAGLKLFGFFLVGLPWEAQKHLDANRKHIFDVDADFIELHIALPYYGTELYEIASQSKLLTKEILGTNYFSETSKGTVSLSSKHLLSFRDNTLLKYHLRPSYIAKRLLDCLKQPRVVINYLWFGFKLVRNFSTQTYNR